MAKLKIKTIKKLLLKNLNIFTSNQLYQIICIFLLALILRTLKLGEYPIGFHVDEVKVGWNALSLLQTLKDDHLSSLPLYYNTFGDYRPTGIFYLSMPALAIFGNTIFATRLTSAFFGALTVFPIYFLSRKIFKRNEFAGIYAALILTISPWHITISRATSEVAISAFFVVTAIYLAMIKKRFMFNIISIVISYALYHSARLLLPIYLLFSKSYFFLAVLLTLIFALGGSSLERLKQVSIFNSENVKYELEVSKEPKVIVYTRSVIKEYGKYFSTGFLIGEDAKPYRYLTPGVGILNYIDLVLLLVGIYLLISKKIWLPVIFLLASPLPSILTYEDSPNLHRSFYMVLFIAIIEGFALTQIKYRKIPLIILGISLVYFLAAYFKPTLKLPYQKNLYIDSPTYRNIGNSELSKRLILYQQEYKSIYITNFPDNFYPWYAFLNYKNPREFNQKSYVEGSNERRYENIIFTDIKCPSDNITETNVLIVESGECPVESKLKATNSNLQLIEEIKRPDNSVAYYLIKK